MTFHNTTRKTHYNTNQSPSHEQVKKANACRKNQKQVILDYLLKFGAISTVEAYQMSILSPAARIKDLRNQGYTITTIKDYDKNGMATYYLEYSEVSENE